MTCYVQSHNIKQNIYLKKTNIGAQITQNNGLVTLFVSSCVDTHTWRSSLLENVSRFTYLERKLISMTKYNTDYNVRAQLLGAFTNHVFENIEAVYKKWLYPQHFLILQNGCTPKSPYFTKWLYTQHFLMTLKHGHPRGEYGLKATLQRCVRNVLLICWQERSSNR